MPDMTHDIAKGPHGAHHIAPDVHGQNFYAIDRQFQDRATGLFRDSLTRNGFLGLGSKESLRFSAHADAFAPFVPEEKIYQRRDA